ncbi:MAG: hypothetical protein HOO91_11260 [Bacteroidales bacterium]|nr:hypothetical protein [Bacteroidales bacterium]
MQNSGSENNIRENIFKRKEVYIQMVKKLVKPEVNEEVVVPFSEGGGSCSPQRNYADEEIDDITF